MPKKTHGLARGLDSLLPEVDMMTSGGGQEIAIGDIDPNPDQPRRAFSEESIAQLAQSIREQGLLQPILVVPMNGGRYRIVAGERRWRAARMAGLDRVPCIIREMDVPTQMEIALVENLQREDLNPIDEGRALKQLADEFAYSNDDIAEKVGKSRSYVANMIRLTDLNPVVIAMVTEGKLTAGHARSLLTLSDEQQEEQAKKIIALGLNVRQTEQLIGELQGRPTKPSAAAAKGEKAGPQKDINTLALEREISNVLGMSVSIDMKDKQQGGITISFKTLDQLDEVLHRLSHNPGRLAIKG